MQTRNSTPLSVGMTKRVVEVIADLGDSKRRYGSGVIVCGRTVLTAAHVVVDAVKLTVRDPDKTRYPAHAVLNGRAGGSGPDLALVEIDDASVDLPPIALARVDRDSPRGPVERCHAVGYPQFAEIGTDHGTTMRETVDAIGVVPLLSGLADGALHLQVSVSPRSLPEQHVRLGESEWSGMSGAPVVAGGALLGVVTEHAPREGQSTITAAPLTALEADPAHRGWGPGVANPQAWWSRLGVSGLGELTPLPTPRDKPGYLLTLQDLGQTLHRRMPQLVGRERELGRIAAFATSDTRYLRLVGDAYSGKTALLFEAVMTGLPVAVDENVDVVAYFLRRTVSDADVNRFLTVVVPQLAYLCDTDHSAPADEERFRTCGVHKSRFMQPGGIRGSVRRGGLDG